MVDDVALALCASSGREQCGRGDPDRCQFCRDGKCLMLEQFRDEAKAAIVAAYRWHKRERRWPAFVKELDRLRPRDETAGMR